MESAAPHEQLRSAREQRGEDLATLSARTGLRVRHIRAIEEGRFGDLPPGIYARSAIRTFATAYGLRADAVLAGCDAMLPRVDDPIDGLARARGIPSAIERVTPVPERTSETPKPRLRPFGAAIVDGAVTGGLVLAASAGAALLARVSITAFRSSGLSLFLLSLIFEAAYYTWMGGLRGTTFGESAVGREPLHRDPRPLTLRAIGRRALAAGTADARAIYLIGARTGRRFTRAAAARTAPPPEPSPSPLPPPDREEALTWSANQRASVPPPPLRPRHG